jgi:peptidoglycan hydrolase-like protein with peptidoglycan-binding domain
VRRAFLIACGAVALLMPARALADGPTATATPSAGAAPLTVTLAASGGVSGAYHWDLGDGTFADGAVVQHTYAAGQWIAAVTDGGATATVVVRAEGVSLRAPVRVQFGATTIFTGAVVPATPGEVVALRSPAGPVAQSATAADGTFRIRVAHLTAPGPYVAQTATAASTPASLLVRPHVATSFRGAAFVGGRVAVTASLQPRRAGSLRLRVFRDGTLVADRRGTGTLALSLRAGSSGTLRAVTTVQPSDGYLAAAAESSTVVLQPTLRQGARGPSVRVLEQRLAAMHYALRAVDGFYGDDTAEAVLAFQKVHGLARTGEVDRALWTRILHGATPPAHNPHGNHVEVDKTRQVLFEVRDGKVALVVHVSTGATGNTPVGTWHVYRRVPGFDWVLYYPTYFLRGFAIHGYPDVPAYPASHGCVRVPMWIAQRLYAMDAYGDTIIVYP